MIKKILALILTLSVVTSLFGCLDGIYFIDETDNDGAAGGSAGGEVVFQKGEAAMPEKWVDTVMYSEDTEVVQVALGESLDLSKYVELPADELTWFSDCPEVASLDGSVVTAHRVGRTEIAVYQGEEKVSNILLLAENYVCASGYDFKTTKNDGTTYKVESLKEANAVLDRAVMNRMQYVTIDFSGVSPSFSVERDFSLNAELSTHAYFSTIYSKATPHIVNFLISYINEAATYTTPESEKYTYKNLPSANRIIRSYLAEQYGALREDDYDGFAINSREDTIEVYNSEELWWAVEHGYKPVFPMSGTKAEMIYERAKMVLREIITDDMTQYQRVLAIYEYLIEAVAYDYDAVENTKGGIEEKKNTCYYLEGVFEVGRAVCDGKAKAFVLLCGIEGINCVRAFGLYDENIGHAWNYVEVDGTWYLVDTTGGDRLCDSDSSIAEYAGGQFETVDYGYFLVGAYKYKGEYEYTDLWSHLISTSHNVSYGETYYSKAIRYTGYDFLFRGSAEANAILSVLYEAGMPGKFVLVFKSSDGRTYDYFLSIAETYGLRFELFRVELGVYYAIFK